MSEFLGVSDLLDESLKLLESSAPESLNEVMYAGTFASLPLFFWKTWLKRDCSDHVTIFCLPLTSRNVERICMPTCSFSADESTDCRNSST